MVLDSYRFKIHTKFKSPNRNRQVHNPFEGKFVVLFLVELGLYQSNSIRGILTTQCSENLGLKTATIYKKYILLKKWLLPIEYTIIPRSSCCSKAESKCRVVYLQDLGSTQRETSWPMRLEQFEKLKTIS